MEAGDIVVVAYRGEITQSNEVTGAYTMYKGTLVEGDVEIAE